MKIWCLNNKLIVVLGLLSFCLFVSTLTIASQRNHISKELADLRASLLTTTTIKPTTQPPVVTTTEPHVVTTDSPVTTEAPTTELPTTTESPTTEPPTTESK